MAPKKKTTAADIKASLLGKGKSEAPVTTPESKAATKTKPAVTPDAPDVPAKRRKVEAEAEPEKPIVVPVCAAGGILSDTGPMCLWTGAAGPDPKALGSPAFHPALIVDQYPVGKPVGFELLSKVLSEIEGVKGSGAGSRKKSTILLTNMFRTILYCRPEDLIPAIYLLCNKVAPDYEESELGVGDALVIKAMCESFGKTAHAINHTINSGDAKDLGEVALMSRLAQKVLMLPPKLTTEKVFAEMKGIAHEKGKNSMNTKKDRMKKMLVASRGEEAKYIVRMLQAKLRVGIQIPTLLQAIAAAFVLTAPARGKTESVSDTRHVKGTTLVQVEERMTSMESAVKQAYHEMPNFDLVVGALLQGRDGSNLAEVCHISLGVPVKPMLAKPAKGIREVAERLSGKTFTGEYKYDGERAQIHVVSKDKILVYSRNSENMTEKYPDVIKVIKESLADDVESCIIDSELVAYDQVSGRILPFQILSTRGRKNIDIDLIKVNVCVYPFDCMLLNGKPLVTQTLETRRAALWKILREIEGKVKFAVYRNFDDLKEEEVQAFLDESIAASCEGLMLKTLTDNATYTPSKRSLNWLKLKKDYLDGVGDSIDVVPIGAYYGKGKRTGAFGAFLLAIYDHENEEYQTVCKAGTGFSDEDLQTHYKFYKEHSLQKPESNYNVSEKLAPDVWLEACQVWEIKAADLSISPVHTSAFGVKADGKGIGLRFPRFLRIRDDKNPEDSTGPDQIVEMFESQASVGKGDAMDDDC